MNIEKVTMVNFTDFEHSFHVCSKVENSLIGKCIHLNWDKIIGRSHRDLNSDRWIQSPEC